ncbi:unnamed protein product [Gadus morhua 'NCC']
MKLVNIFLLWSELEEDSERLHRRRVERRRRRLYCRSLCHHNVEARHYCQINATVPVLQRFFQGEDTRPDFRLSRQAIQDILPHQKQEGILPPSSPCSGPCCTRCSFPCGCRCAGSCSPSSHHLILLLHSDPNLAWPGWERAHYHWR